MNLKKEKIQILKKVAKILKSYIKEGKSKGICFIIAEIQASDLGARTAPRVLNICSNVRLNYSNATLKQMKLFEAGEELEKFLMSQLYFYDQTMLGVRGKTKVSGIHSWLEGQGYQANAVQRSIVRLRWVKAIIKALENNEEVKPDWN